ncbi:MAG: SpoIIIAH-like family protein, partial [Catenibacillus sp.]|nr:SpoIIIAH-like family protein [Catenibacillus sp.]
DMAIVDAAAEGGDGTESAENADSAGAENGETENIDDVGSIGEAVLTSSQAAKGFSAAAKLNREQVRSQNKEMLMEIINDSAGDAAVKAEAADSLKALAETAEKEQAAETLLEAKGFKNSVVSITEDGVDVVICLESLDDTQRTQIEDIVKRKAGVGAESIVITTLNE